MQEYLKDPIEFTSITLAPVDTAFYDPYGDQTWRKPLETTDVEEEAKQDSTIYSKDVLTHHGHCHAPRKLVKKVAISWSASWIAEILHVLMPPIQNALEELDPTVDNDLNVGKVSRSGSNFRIILLT